ncbi:MAG TPA: Ig-like domain-containing protein, partial [Pengzhenrongella sp.]
MATIDRRITGTVAGVVVTGSGAPIANAQVDICPSGEACKSTVADAQGAFRQDDLLLGRFYVRAQAQVTGNPTNGTAGGTLLFEGDVAEVTISLLGLSTIEGTVFETVNGVRQPARNATVQLSGQPGSGCTGWVCTQGTDINGSFRFLNVPARSFTVTAFNLAGQRGSVGDVINPGSTRTGLEIDLAAAFEVRGRVLASNGDVAAGVVAELTKGAAHLFAETGPDGTFAFSAIQSGAFSIFFQDPVGPGLARKAATVIGAAVDLGDILLDAAPPSVVDSTPADGALGVSRSSDLRVRFSEAVSAATVNDATVTLAGPDGKVTGLIDLVEGDTVVRFQLLPGTQLRDQARYALRVSGVKDLVGRSMQGDFVGAFSTVDITPPSVVETTPAASASGAAVVTTIRVRYGEIIDPSKFVGPAIALTGPQGAVAGRIDAILGNTVMVFTPQYPLAEDTQYQVQVARASDQVGNVQTSDLHFVFSTTDRTPPVVTSLLPSSPTVVENAVVVVVATVATTDVAFVDFFVNGTFVYTNRTAPFAMSLLATPAYGGPGSRLTISAIATDTSGNRGVAPATVFVDVVADQLPVPTIMAPAAGASAANGQRVDVQVRATDDVGVTKLAYTVKRQQPGPNGSAIVDAQSRTFATTRDRTENFAFTIPLDVLPGAVLTIEATAWDTAGASRTSSPLSVVVLDAIGPAVQITGVSSGQRVQPGQTVTAVVSASDAGGVATIGFATSGVTMRSEQRQVAPAQNSVATSFQFTVPANATSTDRVVLSAFAIDASSNRTDAAQVTLPVADRQPPTVSLHTASGSLTMVPGATVSIVVSGNDDV